MISLFSLKKLTNFGGLSEEFTHILVWVRKVGLFKVRFLNFMAFFSLFWLMKFWTFSFKWSKIQEFIYEFILLYDINLTTWDFFCKKLKIDSVVILVHWSLAIHTNDKIYELIFFVAHKKGCEFSFGMLSQLTSSCRNPKISKWCFFWIQPRWNGKKLIMA